MRFLSLIALPVLLAACSTDAPDGPAPDPAPARAGAPASPDACGLLTAEAVQQHVPEARGAAITVADQQESHRYNEDSRSCTWAWGDGHRVNLQVTTEPAGNRFDTWGSRMVSARLEQGYVPVDGLGDGAAFAADGAGEVFWREGEERIYALSYGGPSPQARLGREPLVALAHAVDG